LPSAGNSKSTPVVQLASVSDAAAAKTMASRLQSQYSAFLGGATLRVVKADLGSKGTFYRIQSQPVSSDMASQICAALKNHNAGCLIVR
jgi:SPOR domain